MEIHLNFKYPKLIVPHTDNRKLDGYEITSFLFFCFSIIMLHTSREILTTISNLCIVQSVSGSRFLHQSSVITDFGLQQDVDFVLFFKTPSTTFMSFTQTRVMISGAF